MWVFPAVWASAANWVSGAERQTIMVCVLNPHPFGKGMGFGRGGYLLGVGELGGGYKDFFMGKKQTDFFHF